jgi:SAM-dependent methyltransferase
MRMADIGCEDPRGKDFDGWMYGPINQDFFDEMLRHVERRRELTFLDVGMGKGLALMLAARWGFDALMGIELSAPLIDIARDNFGRYERKTGRRIEAQVLCGDFMELKLSDAPTLFFLNNPFPHEIAALAVAHILKSLAELPRRVVIVYRRAAAETQALLDASPLLRSERRTPYWKIWSSVRHTATRRPASTCPTDN